MPFVHLDELAQAGASGMRHQVVAQQHAEWLVTDQIPRHQDGMPQPAWL